MPPVRIGYFRKANGRTPARLWLESLSTSEQRYCADLIAALFLQGSSLGEPKSKRLQGHQGLFELRGTAGGVQVRIFYTFMPGGVAVLLEGVRKTSPGEQARAIERAVAYQSLVQHQPDLYITLDP